MCSRLRENVDKVFELFLEISPPQNDGKDPVILRKYPPDFNQQDVLVEIPKFAYPCKNDIFQVEQFVFVLTDMDGMFRYVYCRHGTSCNTCLCIMSHLQWFDIFYKMLNFLADIVNSSEDNDPRPFLEATYVQDIPIPETPVTIVAGSRMLSFTVPKHGQLPSIHTNRNLTEYYNAMDAGNMMKIFASMLHERRIIITSKKLSRITACVHASEALLYPMHWQHLFIPVLPSHVIDMVTAPMPYLIGVHSSLMEMITAKHTDLGDAVIVDADRNEVKSEHDDLEALPDEVSSYLKRQLKPQKVQTSMLVSGDAISKAFLLSLVRLIGGYRDALKFHDDGPITFDHEAFVQSRTSRSTQAFLQGMLHLQIFQQFITGRLELLNARQGFNDVFEHESIQYADHLNTQSKYREWLAKKTRKLKITDLKDNLKDKVNEQRKKVMSKLRELNENKTSGQIKRPGEGDQRHCTMPGPRSSKPPMRPPPPSQSALQGRNRSTVYKTVVVEDQETSSHHGNSVFHGFSVVSVTMDSDSDLRMTLTRSASVDDLLFSKTEDSEGDASSISSTEVQALTNEDSGFSDHMSRPSQAFPVTPSTITQYPPQPRNVGTSDRLIPTDRLIMPAGSPRRRRAEPVSCASYEKGAAIRDSSDTPPVPAALSRCSEPPPIPVKRAGLRGSSPLSWDCARQAPPIPRPRNAQTWKKEREESPPPPPLPCKRPQAVDAALIQFDSTSTLGGIEFDPLVPGERSFGKSEDESRETEASAGFEPMLSSFQRSATYRRAMEDRPVIADSPGNLRAPTAATGRDCLTTISNNSKDHSNNSRSALPTDSAGMNPLSQFDLHPQDSVSKGASMVARSSQHTVTSTQGISGIEPGPSGLPSDPGVSSRRPTTTIHAADPSSLADQVSATVAHKPLHPPPPVPRPRPRQVKSELLPSRSVPPPRPSVPAKALLQKHRPQADGTIGAVASGDLKDRMVLENNNNGSNSKSSSGMAENSAQAWSSSQPPTSNVTQRERIPPVTVRQRANMPVRMKQSDSGVGGAAPHSSPSPGLQLPLSLPPQPSSSGPKWETFY